MDWLARIIHKAQVANILQEAKVAAKALIDLEKANKLRVAPKMDGVDLEEDIRGLEKDNLTDEEERGVESREPGRKPVSTLFFSEIHTRDEARGDTYLTSSGYSLLAMSKGRSARSTSL